MSRRFKPLVLCYHAAAATWDHHLSVPPRALERQLRLLIAQRYRAVPAAELVAGGGRLLHVTFDDAFRSVLDALPVIERLGVPATVFACAGLADGGQAFPIAKLPDDTRIAASDLRTLSWDGLRALVERGHEVGSHTVSHPHLTRISDLELTRELRESREHLESELGRRCRFLAYPYGDHDRRVRVAAREAGYEAAFALPGRARPFDPFGIPRVGIWRKDGLVRFMLKTSAARRPIGTLRRSR
jgi:peptidoglycan/xylan/chitin deacetylase (PgdA/CDA1 family)